MNPRKAPSASSGAPNRPARKCRVPIEGGESQQRVRKRTLDREAQRTFREKTKNYIAHLEQTIEACKAESNSQLVCQLLEENASLYSTVERLRRIISDVYSATQPETFERNQLCKDTTLVVDTQDKQDDDGLNESVSTRHPSPVVVANQDEDRSNRSSGTTPVTSATASAAHSRATMTEALIGFLATPGSRTDDITACKNAAAAVNESSATEPFSDMSFLPAGSKFAHSYTYATPDLQSLDQMLQNYFAPSTDLDTLMGGLVSPNEAN